MQAQPASVVRKYAHEGGGEGAPFQSSGGFGGGGEGTGGGGGGEGLGDNGGGGDTLAHGAHSGVEACTATKLHDAWSSFSYGSQDAEPSPPPITHRICSPHVPSPLDASVPHTSELQPAVPQDSHQDSPLLVPAFKHVPPWGQVFKH